MKVYLVCFCTLQPNGLIAEAFTMNIPSVSQDELLHFCDVLAHFLTDHYNVPHCFSIPELTSNLK